MLLPTLLLFPVHLLLLQRLQLLKQQGRCQAFVGMLAALGFNPHRQAAGDMGRADGRVCGVHVLPSGARGAAGLKVDLLIQSLVIDLKHLAAEEPVFAFVPGPEAALAAPEHGSLPSQRQVLGPGFIIGTELQQDRLETGDAGFSVCLSHLQQLAAYALRLTLPLYGLHRQGALLIKSFA